MLAPYVKESIQCAHDLGLYAVGRRPIAEEADLHAVPVGADAFAVKGGIVLRADLAVPGRNEEIVFLRAHRHGREQHALRPFFRKGNIAQQVDFAV